MSQGLSNIARCHALRDSQAPSDLAQPDSVEASPQQRLAVLERQRINGSPQTRDLLATAQELFREGFLAQRPIGRGAAFKEMGIGAPPAVKIHEQVARDAEAVGAQIADLAESREAAQSQEQFLP